MCCKIKLLLNIVIVCLIAGLFWWHSNNYGRLMRAPHDSYKFVNRNTHNSYSDLPAISLYEIMYDNLRSNMPRRQAFLKLLSSMPDSTESNFILMVILNYENYYFALDLALSSIRESLVTGGCSYSDLEKSLLASRCVKIATDSTVLWSDKLRALDIICELDGFLSEDHILKLDKLSKNGEIKFLREKAKRFGVPFKNSSNN